MRVLRGIKDSDFIFYLFEHNDYVRNCLVNHVYTKGHIVDTSISLVDIHDEIPKDKDGKEIGKDFVIHDHTYDIDIITEDNHHLSTKCLVSVSDEPYMLTYSIGSLPSYQGIEGYTGRVLICDNYLNYDTKDSIFCAKVIKEYYDPVHKCFKYDLINNMIVQTDYFNDKDMLDSKHKVIKQLVYLLKYGMKYDDNEFVNSIIDSYDEYLNMEEIIC